MFWKNKRVLVTGGTGFIGSFVVEKLVKRGASVSVLDTLRDGKIKNIGYLKDAVRFIKGNCADMDTARKACKDQDVVMNLAAHVGGIEYNRFHQATMLRENLEIAAIMIEAARLEEVERYLVVSSACIYPRNAKIPTPETEGFLDEPEPTNGGYGWAKRVAEKLGMYYAQEYGMKIGIVRPYNAYGPRDHFDPASSHVIPALIKKAVEAKQSNSSALEVWGTGTASREFLYVEDAAKAIALATLKYDKSDPVNIGSGMEISIKDLIEKIVSIVGFKGQIVWDKSKPDGQPRRCLDTSRAEKEFGFKAQTDFTLGLQKTIDWYLSKNIHSDN